MKGKPIIRLVIKKQEITLSDFGRYIIGRAGNCDVQILDKGVSRYHCAIDIKAEGAYLRDLYSTNGTLINGKEIESKTELLKGDRLQVGDAVFTVLSSQKFAVKEVEQKNEKDATGISKPVEKKTSVKKKETEDKPVIKVNRGVIMESDSKKTDEPEPKPEEEVSDKPVEETDTEEQDEAVSAANVSDPESEPESEPEVTETEKSESEEPEVNEFEKESEPEDDDTEKPVPDKEPSQSIGMVKIVAGTVIILMVFFLILKLIPTKDKASSDGGTEKIIEKIVEKEPEKGGTGAQQTPQELLRELDRKFKKELASIEDYAALNPDDVKEIQARYQALADNYKETFYEERAQAKLDEFIKAYKKAKEEAFKKKLAEVETYTAQKRYYLALKRCTEIFREPELPDDAQDRLKQKISRISAAAKADYDSTVEKAEALVKEEAYEDAVKLLRKKADTLGMFTDELLLTLNVPPYSEQLIKEADRVGDIMWENYEKKRRTMERVHERIIMLLKQKDFPKAASYIRERISALKSNRLSKGLKKLLPVAEKLSELRQQVIKRINAAPVKMSELKGTILKADERVLTVRDDTEGRNLSVSWRNISDIQLKILFEKCKALKKTEDKKALSSYFFTVGDYELAREFSRGEIITRKSDVSFTGMPLKTFRSGRKWEAFNGFKAFMVFPDPKFQTASAYSALKHYGITGGIVSSRGNSQTEGSDDSLSFIVQDSTGNTGLNIERTKAEKAFTLSRQNPDAHPALIRPECYNNPAVWKRITDAMRQSLATHKQGQPAAYSISRLLSSEFGTYPADWCYCEFCAEAFKKHLPSVYKDVNDLNDSWGTAFGSYAEVMPRTLYQTIRENSFFETRWAERDMRYPELMYAPFNDFREWRDINIAAKVKELSDAVRKMNPGAAGGFSGFGKPAIFGGCDYSLMLPSTDWAGFSTDFGQSELIRSLTVDAYPRIYNLQINNNLPEAGKFEILYHFFHGGKGVIINSMSEAYSSGADRQPREAMPFIREAIQITQGELGQRISEAAFRKDKVGIYFSRVSNRFHWLIDSGISRESWPDKLASISSESLSGFKAMNAFADMLENSGYQYEYISSRKVIEHGISPKEYNVIILPKTVALSNAEADALTAYVNKGGKLVADYQTGMMDEHLNGRSEGILDRVFGIRRKNYVMVEWFESLAEPTTAGIGLSKPIKSNFRGMMAVEEGVVALEGNAQADAGGIPVVIVNSYGQGTTYYLNLNMLNYDDIRFSDVKQGERMRMIFDNIMKDAGLFAPVEVYKEDGSFYPNTEVLIWNTPEEDYLIILQNAKFSEKKGVTVITPAINEPPHPINIKLTGGPREVFNWREKQSLGNKDVWKDLFIPHQPLVYVVR